MDENTCTEQEEAGYSGSTKVAGVTEGRAKSSRRGRVCSEEAAGCTGR